MKLTRFRARRLNHIRELSVDFNESLNFITGVNGSGKTSLLTAIVSLLTPSLEGLASLNYESISVEVEINGKKHEISSTRDDDGLITLKVRDARQPFIFEPFEDDEFYSQNNEYRVRYYQALLSDNAENKTLKFLSGLSTPMYLGLDRRYRGASRATHIRPGPRLSRRRKRNIFGSSLGESVTQAISLAEDRYSEVQTRSGRLNREFVKDLLLSLISVPVTDHFGVIEAPSKLDRALVDQAIKTITKFPRIEGISADDVRQRIEPALKDINDTLSLIPAGFDLSKVPADQVRKNPNIVSALIKWSSFKPTIAQVNALSSLIKNYNERLAEINRDIERYTRLIDTFIGETGKTFGFDDRGYLQVEYGGSRFGVEELSSGEAQIFVLLTHLSFNPDAKSAGIFLIDEPELSLHILWQEILVESLIKANSSVQYVMATHSPSVILDRTECAIDLSDFARPNA